MNQKRKYIKWSEEEKEEIKNMCIIVLIENYRENKVISFRDMIELAQEKALPPGRHRDVNEKLVQSWLNFDELKKQAKSIVEAELKGSVETNEDLKQIIINVFKDEIQPMFKVYLEDSLLELFSVFEKSNNDRLEMNINYCIKEIEKKIEKKLNKLFSQLLVVFKPNETQLQKDPQDDSESSNNSETENSCKKCKKRVRVFGLPGKHHGIIIEEYKDKINLSLMEPPTSRGSRAKQLKKWNGDYMIAMVTGRIGHYEGIPKGSVICTGGLATLKRILNSVVDGTIDEKIIGGIYKINKSNNS